MSATIDRIFGWIKWPVAVVHVCLLPGAAWAFVSALGLVGAHAGDMIPFFAGFGLYGALWWLAFRRYGWGSWASTLEHELTHALFALLTFHRVTKITASWHDGGATSFRGRGNWLITLAPYFVPTASVLIAAFLWAIPDGWLHWASGLLGASIAYHMSSTWLETHFRQTDITKAGLIFSLMFLPTANLVAYGLLLGVAADGGAGMAHYADALWSRTGAVFGAIGEIF